MELADFVEAADQRTGLVPMKIVRPFMPYGAGQVAGFPPDVAMSYEINGLAVRHSRRDRDVIDASGPAAGSHGAPPVPGPDTGVARTTMYDRAPEIAPAQQTAPPVGLSAAGRLPQAEIPSGWESMAAAELRKLAANLSGRSYQTLSEAASREIISNAIAGRHPDDTGTGSPSLASQEEAAASQQTGTSPVITTGTGTPTSTASDGAAGDGRATAS